MAEYEIPKECRAGVVVNEGPDFRVEVQMVPVPEIGPEDVLIKLNVTGICHSDIHFMANDLGLGSMSSYGTKCAGHEGAGVIVKVGERVSRLRIGQRAGFKPIADACGTCEHCRAGKDAYCANSVLTGLHTDGSYQQYVRSPERYTTLIPDNVPDHVAGPVMCSASTMYSSIKESELVPGDWAVFPGGGGGVGIQGVQLAVAVGLRPVVVDTGAGKRKLAMELGAEAFVDFKNSDDVVAEVINVCDGVGAHGVFVTAPQSYPSALAFLGKRVGGKVMCVALPTRGAFQMTVNPSELIGKGKSIRGTLVSSIGDVDRALKFAQQKKLRLQPEILGVSKFNEAVQRLRNGQVSGRIVIDFNQE
ncbi:hypothetical protein BDV12DRAFT_203750 [Aspergillus spectabilis]